MIRAIEQIRNTFSEFGIGAGLVFGLAHLLEICKLPLRLFFYELMIQPVATKKMAPPNLAKSFEVREISEGDPLLETTPPPLDVIHSRYRQDSVCLGAFQKGVFIGYQWLCFGPYIEDEVRCIFVPQPPSEAVFDFDFYLFPNYRFGLGFVALWDAANEYMRERGITTTTSRVSRFNTASRKSHDHLGWCCVGRTIFLKSNSFQLMLASIRPYVHVSIGRSSGPVIHIGSRASPRN